MSATLVSSVAPPPAVRTAPVSDPEPSGWSRVVAQAVTVAFVVGPVVALAVAVSRLWGHGLSGRDVVLAVGLYYLVGHGVTIGFHRLFAHRSFVARRGLKIGLAVLGSMAFEGGVIPWVDNHRLHHSFSDRDGDPHSPLAFGVSGHARLRGLWHAHVGWLFSFRAPPGARVAADLRADGDLVVISALFPLWCGLSLAVPFGLGWVWGGGVGAGLTALLWAGGVRILVLHHATWSINSLCHMFGRRRFATPDHSTDVAVLAPFSFGESWHNAHHAFPRGARHGIGPGQLDTSATLIHLFERAGWATDVHWTKRIGSLPTTG